jgi:hypothetical protein
MKQRAEEGRRKSTPWCRLILAKQVHFFFFLLLPSLVGIRFQLLQPFNADSQQ